MELDKFDFAGIPKGNSGVSYNSLRLLANLRHAMAIRYCFLSRKQTGLSPRRGRGLWHS
jgi:hypothetical protein